MKPKIYVRKQSVIKGVIFDHKNESDCELLKRFNQPRIEYEAMQFEGDRASANSLVEWANRKEAVIKLLETLEGLRLAVFTYDGVEIAQPWDWIMRGSRGDFCVFHPHYFDSIYEEVYSVCRY